MPNNIEAELPVKIIGKRKDKDEKFFSSLRDALKAFLEGEINKLTIEGQDLFFCFSLRGGVIAEQLYPGSFEEHDIDAPVVFLKLIGWDKEMNMTQPMSLGKAFLDFFSKKIMEVQIYEQIEKKFGFFGVVTNYLVIFGWSDDGQKILLHLHNVDIENHFWRQDFQYQKHASGDLRLIPVFGSPYAVDTNFSNN